jgi:two-component system, NtrC family, response regulator AtoC
VSSFSHEAREALLGYPWPGNIRELENVVERCMLFTDGSVVELDHLPPELRGAQGALTSSVSAAPLGGDACSTPLPLDAGLKETVREATAKLERELIVRALEQNGGNVTRTARLLKISRKGLQTKMKELGLRGADR